MSIRRAPIRLTRNPASGGRIGERIALYLLVAALHATDASATAQKFKRPIQLSEAEEIALTLSAAPAHIATAATVLVLRDSGYQTARAGTNGFTCLVEHEDPKAVEPVCYDAEGSATTLEVARYLARRRLAGQVDSVTRRDIAEGYRTARFLSPRRGRHCVHVVAAGIDSAARDVVCAVRVHSIVGPARGRKWVARCAHALQCWTAERIRDCDGARRCQLGRPCCGSIRTADEGLVS